MTSGWQGASYLKRCDIQSGAGFKTGDFVEEKVGEGVLPIEGLLSDGQHEQKKAHLQRQIMI